MNLDMIIDLRRKNRWLRARLKVKDKALQRIEEMIAATHGKDVFVTTYACRDIALEALEK